MLIKTNPSWTIAERDATYEQIFLNSFPIQISDLELTGSGSELLTFDVTFTFDNWLLVD